MSRYISESLTNEINSRANGRCEYCRISIEDTFFGGEIDHIRSLKHFGKTETANLALACQPCNRSKGTDLGSISSVTEQLIRFFNPRSDNWSDHFRLSESGEIETLTEIGEVTAKILGFNNTERLLERQGLMELGRYPG